MKTQKTDKPRREASEETDPADLDYGLPAPRTVRNFLLSKLPNMRFFVISSLTN